MLPTVTWDRKSGQVYARGNVVIVTPEGDKLVGDNVQLTDTLKDGTVDNLMVVLESGEGSQPSTAPGSMALGPSTTQSTLRAP